MYHCNTPLKTMPNFPIGWPRFLFQGREYDCTTSIGISGGMFSAIKLNRNENKLIEYSYMKVILFRLLAGFLFIIELVYMIFLDKELSSDGLKRSGWRPEQLQKSKWMGRLYKQKTRLDDI